MFNSNWCHPESLVISPSLTNLLHETTLGCFSFSNRICNEWLKMYLLIANKFNVTSVYSRRVPYTFFHVLENCCVITSTFCSKSSRPLDVWSVLMEDFTAHWVLMSWSLLIREQLSRTLTSCPINRPGLCTLRPQSCKDKIRSPLIHFQVWDFGLCTISLLRLKGKWENAINP